MTLVSIVSVALTWVFGNIIVHSITWLKTVAIWCGQGHIHAETQTVTYSTFTFLKLDLILEICAKLVKYKSECQADCTRLDTLAEYRHFLL